VVSIPTVTVQLDTLGRFCREAAERMGVPLDAAEIFVDVLLAGSLRSLPGQGQGVQQLPVYYERIQRGVVDVDADFELMGRHGGVALVNAHRGLGSVSATKAMSLAVELAGEQGIGAVGVRDSTHFGIAAYYAMLALPHDFVGIAFSNAGPEIAPWGAHRRRPAHHRCRVGVGRDALPARRREGIRHGRRRRRPDRRPHRLGVRARVFRCGVAERRAPTDCARRLPFRAGRRVQRANGRADRPNPLVAVGGRHRRDEERRTTGIPIVADRFDALLALGAELDVPTPLEGVLVG
jgi:LDH2 family malate/lactate/ureidoglycolate dehydrogenase